MSIWSSRALLCAGAGLKPSPLVKLDGHTQHVFRWGIGNKFRSSSVNRLSPVHLPRPKEVTVRVDYFQSPTESVRYDPVNEQWEVYWYEFHKLNAKPFPVKKFGVEESKLEAIKFNEELIAKQRNESTPSRYPTESRDILWDDRLQTYFAPSKDGKKMIGFSAVRHGPAQALKLAKDQVEKCKPLQQVNALRDECRRILGSEVKR